MGIDSAINRFRRRQERLFDSEARVDRGADIGAFNSGTGEHDPATPTTIYSGPCLIRGTKWRGTDTATGEQEVRFRDINGKFPVDTPLRKDDVVTMLDSEHDADLVGAVFRITDVLTDEWQIARVVILEETT